MRSQINFSNFPASPALANVVDAKLANLERSDSHNRIQTATVQLKIVNSKHHPGPDKHECTIEIDLGSVSRKKYFVKKTKDNMYKAIASAFNAARRVIQERLPYMRKRFSRHLY